MSPDEIQKAKAALAEHGYVVIKEKSHLAARRRQQIAESQREWAERERESSRRWAHDCLDQERHLRERLTFVWGVAKAHGATNEELGGCSDHPRPALAPVPTDTDRNTT